MLPIPVQATVRTSPADHSGTVIAAGVLAATLAAICHETLGHGLGCIGVGGRITLLTSIWFQCKGATSLTDAGGSIASFAGDGGDPAFVVVGNTKSRRPARPHPVWSLEPVLVRGSVDRPPDRQQRRLGVHRTPDGMALDLATDHGGHRCRRIRRDRAVDARGAPTESRTDAAGRPRGLCCIRRFRHHRGTDVERRSGQQREGGVPYFGDRAAGLAGRQRDGWPSGASKHE